ncbi:MAG TPA: hypothetical protein VFA06_24950, partial [Actinocrinis sp.]|uniref:hypothetical protein n=1 Tax=Actinocrinis sp. TaxID=1920516 RepID=UPI002D32C0CE
TEHTSYLVGALHQVAYSIGGMMAGIQAIHSNASRRRTTIVLRLSLAAALAGCPILLAAHDTAVAMLGLAVAGIGIGGTFPLASSLHVAASGRSADQALGQILTVAGIGQITGPLTAGALAQTADLRLGLLVLPALILLAGATTFSARARPSG